VATNVSDAEGQLSACYQQIGMSEDKSPPVRTPESEDDAVRIVEEDMDEGEELDDQKRALIRAQKFLID